MSTTSPRNNPSIIKATLLSGLFLYATWRTWFLYDTPYVWVPIILGIIAGANFITVLEASASFLHNRLLLSEAFASSSLKGSAGWATPAEIRGAGLYRTEGFFLGCDSTGHPIFYNGETHGYLLSPAGGGKTISMVIPTLCHSPLPMIVTDMKGTLEKITRKIRTKKHKQNTYRVDPAEINGPGADRYNPVQILIDDWEDIHGHKDLVADTQAMALQLLPEPPTSGENAFFRSGSRKLITFGLLYLVTQEGGNATLGKLLRLLRNVDALMDAFYIASCSEILNGELGDIAKDLLSKFQSNDNQRQTESFREGSLQALEAFAPSGFLEESTSSCTFRFRDLKDKAATVYLIADPTKSKVFAPWLGLIGWAAILELTRCRNVKPVIFLLDEATNFKIEGLPENLTSLREFGVRCFFIFQEVQEFIKRYGLPAFQTLESQSECKIYFKIQSQKTAELVSQSCGEYTVKSPNYSLGHDHRDKVQKSINESSRRLITPDEVRRLPESESIIFIRNMRPIKAQKLSYAEVSPWKHWVDINPLFGKRLKGKTRVWLSYFWSRPSVSKYKKTKLKPSKAGGSFIYNFQTGLFFLKGFFAVLPLMAIVITFSLEKTPHLRTSYTYYGSEANPNYTSCRYWGKNGAVDTLGGYCPLIALLKNDN